MSYRSVTYSFALHRVEQTGSDRRRQGCRRNCIGVDLDLVCARPDDHGHVRAALVFLAYRKAFGILALAQRDARQPLLVAGPGGLADAIPQHRVRLFDCV